MESESVTSVLQQWGFDNLIDKFAENEIDMEAFKQLTPEIIKELIPKVGIRIKFQQKYNEYLTIFNSTLIVLSDDLTDTIENLSPNCCYNTSAQQSTDSDGVKTSIESTALLQKSFYGLEEHNILNNPTEHLDLNALLSSSHIGNCILKLYNEKKILDRKSRSDLVDIIIKYVYQSYNSCLTNAQLCTLAGKITEIFPNEEREIYYVNPIKKANSKLGKSGVAKGKLVDKYRNIRTRLRKAGLIASQRPSCSSSSSSFDQDETSDISTASKLWLHSRCEPWEDVLFHWKNTYNSRRNSKATNVHDFCNEWPAIKNPKGYVLVDVDFDILFPDRGILIINDWNRFFNHVFEIRKDNLTSEITSELVALLNQEISQNSRIAVQLKLFPYLIPPKGRTRRGKDHWKPSILECQEGILLHATIPGDIEKLIFEKKNSRCAVNETIQPYLIIEGPTITDINKVYVIVDDIRYSFDNLLRGIEVCFKVYHVTNASYPAEAEHIWFLIQWCIFKIKTLWDKPIPYVMDFVATYK